MWMAFTAMLLVNIFAFGTVVAPTTTRIYVDPATNTGAVGTSFSVNINVADITTTVSLYGWEFALSFNPGILQVTGATRGSFLGADTYWAYGFIEPVIDNFNGKVTAGDMLIDLSPGQGKSGSGTLATITFYVIGEGVSALDLSGTYLPTIKSGQPIPIDHNVVDAVFDNRTTKLPPVALFKAPAYWVEALDVAFDASSSDDPDGGWIVSYFWDFGDGTNATGIVVTHAYALRGTYTVSLTITDNDGLTATASKDIIIQNWMEGGWYPDLIRKEAWPEKHQWHEIPDGRQAPFYGSVGNPTANDYQVYVEFKLISKDELKTLGTIRTDTVTIQGGEKLTLSAIMDLTELRWRAFSGSPEWVIWGFYGSNHRKYWVFASAYYNDGTGFKKGSVVKDFGFNVYPEKHDIGVVSVTTSTTNIPTGSAAQIYVNITNKGTMDETFTIKVSYTGQGGLFGIIEQRTITLAAGTSRIETFTWNTDALPLGPYIVKATLPVLTYELPKHTADNEGLTVVYIV